VVAVTIMSYGNIIVAVKCKIQLTFSSILDLTTVFITITFTTRTRFRLRHCYKQHVTFVIRDENSAEHNDNDAQMLPDRRREVYSSKSGFADDGVTLVSCVPKRGKLVTL